MFEDHWYVYYLEALDIIGQAADKTNNRIKELVSQISIFHYNSNNYEVCQHQMKVSLTVIYNIQLMLQLSI